MKKISLSFLIITLAAFLLAGQAGAVDGYYAGSFLRMGLGARATAMGNAFTAIAEGTLASYYNPAGIPLLKHRQLTLSYRFLSLDRNFNYIGFATGIRPKVDEETGESAINGGLAVSWIHAGVDNIDGRDFAGNHYQDFSNAENSFAFSFGVMPLKSLSVGFTGRVLYNRFPDMGDDNATISTTALGLDLGVLFRPFENLSFGAVVKNINAKYDWKTDKLWERDIEKIDRFPMTFRFGVATNFPYRWLLIAADVENSELFGWRFSLGTEAQLMENIFLRGGINDCAPAFGGGYIFKLLGRETQIQYAFVTKKYNA
ncbi:MAG: conjugal transfer protein TraF, partial [Calditrichaeota bacterium]|nr:conjugal transfer protein TraF [Calditrichota bacterium]